MTKKIETWSFKVDGRTYYGWRMASDPFWTGHHDTEEAARAAALVANGLAPCTKCGTPVPFGNVNDEGHCEECE